MRVTVQLFARLRDVAGTGECTVDVGQAATVREVWQALVGRYPALAPFASSISCAVNEDFARLTTVVRQGDAVAFLPPVSGG